MKRFCGFSTGIVFFISGILKLMDPVGTGLIIKEYLDFMHIGFLEPVAKPIGSALALIEAILGTGLITGVWRKLITPITLGLQSVFTLITLILVIFKPEMDCEGAREVERLAGEIEFSGVSYGYDESREVLRGINLKIL